MPKDATKNVDRYKIKGGQLNEFDFQQNQEDFAETSKPDTDGLIPGTPPEKRSQKAKPFLGKIIKRAGKAVKAASSTRTSKAAKASKASKTKPRGATAKKLALRKAAKK